MSNIKIDRLIDEDLKPCPFCGPGNSIVELYETEYKRWVVGCGACGAQSGDHKDKSVVRKTWNNRPGEIVCSID